MMLDKGMSIGYSVISGWWKDTGTVDEFLECNRMVLDKTMPSDPNHLSSNISGRILLEKDVKIDDQSRILGPVFIGEGTTIENSYVGPFTSIGRNCVIKNSEIEDSVIMESCNIELGNNSRIRESLIGGNVSIRPVGSTGQSRRLVLGRDSKLVL